MILNPTSILAEALGNELENNYRVMFGPEEPTYPIKVSIGARFAIEQIANSDALYHDVQHTLLVTMVGQAIFRGRFLTRRLMPNDWVHYTTALLCHDIGYVRGVCSGDNGNRFVINDAGDCVTAPRGASDAFLTPYHVDRGKIFARERFDRLPHLDSEWIVQALELTRFPVPETEDHQATDTWPGLVRAADLIGQLSDPNYPQKLNALYGEFVETGIAERLGYKSSADLADEYPKFYWEKVRPYITDALGYLKMTQEGKQWIANLHSHVFSIEHGQDIFGPCLENDIVDQ